MRRYHWVLALLILLSLPAASAAQSVNEKPKIFVTAGVMGQLTRSTFDDSVAFTVYSEDGAIQQSFKSGRGLRVEVGGGVRVSDKFSIGALVSLMSVNGPLDVTAAVPHPFHFNQARSATFSTTADRSVRDIEVQIMYFVVDSADWLVSVGGGPSFAHVSQDVGTDLVLNDVYPYDSVAISSVTLTKTTGNRIGVNIGASITRLLSARLGVSGDLRWTGASIEVDARTASGKLKLQTGGVQVGASVRIMF